MERPWLKSYEPGIAPEITIPDLTLPEMCEQAVKRNSAGAAMDFLGSEISYAVLGRQITQFAHALRRLGVRKGDRVAIMLPNIPQYVISHFAALQIGAVLVPTNPLYVERELKHQLNDSGAETLILLDLHFSKAENVRAETGLRNIIVARVQDYLPKPLKFLYPLKMRWQRQKTRIVRQPGVHFYHDLMNEKFPPAAPGPETSGEDIAILLYTGGTTGVAKAAVLTHRNLLANVLQIRSWYTGIVQGQEVVLCALPFFHSYGLTTCLHLSVLLNSKMVLIPNPRDIRAILRAIQRKEVTLFSGVPTLFVAINNFRDISKFDLSSVKACVSGGAALPLEVARQFEKISGGKLVEGYGLSEASPVTHANPIYGRRKEGSIGLPLPGTDARVLDPQTQRALAPGEVGELAIRGPQVMQGYWNMSEETAQVLRGGWLLTGDMAKMDEKGYFYIVDRKKDMIIAGGFNIYPREIEEVLYEHPAIQEAAVIGVRDEYRGETVKAFVVCKNGHDLTAEEIIEFCKQRLAAFKIPRMIEFRESLPKSNIGKVLRRVLKEEKSKRTPL